MTGAFQRLADTRRPEIEITVDGDKVRVLEGDTVLTAILLHLDHLRLHEIGEEPRAGFCLMGACQDCWVSESDGKRLRACTTYVRPGLNIVTGSHHPPILAAAASEASAPATASAETTGTATGEPGSATTGEDPA